MTGLDDCITHGCLDPDDLALAREATPADRVALSHYIGEAGGGGVGCLCARLRTDLLLARARGDAAHADRLLAALRGYLVEHGVGIGGCPASARG
jgi:hypothetical protein